jgi:hypothetical protein
MNVSFLRSVTIVPGSDGLADLIEQLGLRERCEHANILIPWQPTVDHRERTLAWHSRVYGFHDCPPRLSDVSQRLLP